VTAPRARALLAALALPLAAGACALRSDVTTLRLQLDERQRLAVRADSVHTASLGAVARLVQTLIDSLNAQEAALGRVRADLRLELLNVEQQLVQIQELTGQSQQRLTELRARLDESGQQLAALLPAANAAAAAQAAGAPARADTTAATGAPATAPGQPASPTAAPKPAPATAAPPEPTADQLMEISLQQLRRNSPGTARAGFAEFLRRFPQHARAVDAEFFTGEAWTADGNADSAAAAYQRVIQRYPASPRAATAMYRLALRALQAGKRDEARNLLTRLTTAYPTSDEAALARERLRALPPGR
jgi:tol-pal system protein YbgF